MKESKEDLKPDQKALEEDKTTNEDYLHYSLEQGCQRAHYLMLSSSKILRIFDEKYKKYIYFEKIIKNTEIHVSHEFASSLSLKLPVISEKRTFRRPSGP